MISFTEPTPAERELALEYPTGSRVAPSVTAAKQHTITGNCMDQRCLSHLLNHCLNTSAQQNVGHFIQPPVPVQTPRDVIWGGNSGNPTHLSSHVAWLLACKPRHIPVTLGGEPTLPTYLPRHKQTCTMTRARPTLGLVQAYTGLLYLLAPFGAY